MQYWEFKKLEVGVINETSLMHFIILDAIIIDAVETCEKSIFDTSLLVGEDQQTSRVAYSIHTCKIVIETSKNSCSGGGSSQESTERPKNVLPTASLPLLSYLKTTILTANKEDDAICSHDVCLIHT